MIFKKDIPEKDGYYWSWESVVVKGDEKFYGHKAIMVRLLTDGNNVRWAEIDGHMYYPHIFEYGDKIEGPEIITINGVDYPNAGIMDV